MTRSPQELRDVLGENLRVLTKDGPPITQVCRELGINRTQFNRYLAGEAYPRPDILYKICEHFETDARILLEPLPFKVEADHPLVPKSFDISNLYGGALTFDHAKMPDGLYRFLRPSFYERGRVLVCMAHIFTLSTGVKAMRARISPKFKTSTGVRFSPDQRTITGLLTQMPDGVAAMTSLVGTPSNSFSFVNYGYKGLDHHYTGYSCITHAKINDQTQIQPFYLERIMGGCSEALAAARECGSIEIQNVHPQYRNYFENWSV